MEDLLIRMDNLLSVDDLVKVRVKTRTGRSRGGDREHIVGQRRTDLQKVEVWCGWMG